MSDIRISGLGQPIHEPDSTGELPYPTALPIGGKEWLDQLNACL